MVIVLQKARKKKNQNSSCLFPEQLSYHHKLRCWFFFLLNLFLNKSTENNTSCFNKWQGDVSVVWVFCLFFGTERKVLVFLGKRNMTSWYHSKMGRRGAQTSLISATLVLYTSSFLFYHLQKHFTMDCHPTWIDSRVLVPWLREALCQKKPFLYIVEQKKH